MISQAFCRGASLKELKVESYNQFCFALILSYQLQLSHCPSSQLSLFVAVLFLSCDSSVSAAVTGSSGTKTE